MQTKPNRGVHVVHKVHSELLGVLDAKPTLTELQSVAHVRPCVASENVDAELIR